MDNIEDGGLYDDDDGKEAGVLSQSIDDIDYDDKLKRQMVCRSRVLLTKYTGTRYRGAELVHQILPFVVFYKYPSCF
jgi:hypothetical protein